MSDTCRMARPLAALVDPYWNGIILTPPHTPPRRALKICEAPPTPKRSKCVRHVGPLTTLPCRLYGLRMGKVKVTTRALRTALAATLGAALASTGTAAAAGRLQQQGPGTGDGPDPNAPRCKQLPVTSDRWIVPGNGDHAPTPGSPSNPNAVELRGFSTPDKPSFTQVLPSPDFDPANASSATMSALGFPTKPEAKSDLAKWKHDVEHSTTRRFGLCEVAGAHFTTDASLVRRVRSPATPLTP